MNQEQRPGEGRQPSTPARDRARLDPNRVAVYGTLLSDGSAAHLLRPLVAERERDTVLPGTLFDTKQGYPALVLDDGPGVAAEVYRLADPVDAFPLLDDYEGPEYEREVLVLPDGRPCWIYRWLGETFGMRRLPHGWLNRGRDG